MKIAMVGTGYVGLVTGTCLSGAGSDVWCLDIDVAKVKRLQQCEIPIYEPGLEERLHENVAAGTLHFTTDAAEAVRGAQAVFLAVGTPQSADGSANLNYLFQAAASVAPLMDKKAVLVIKSTVPVGTNREVARRVKEQVGYEIQVVSNPEFLKEGSAVQDFVLPDRVVVGTTSPAAAELLRQIYAPFLAEDRPFLVMGWESAEMTKYVANCFLATKISFINETANLCERLHADINEVRRGIGFDQRIGFSFLAPGAGYGGSCFPKDVQALMATARNVQFESTMLNAVDAVNVRQKRVLFEKISRHFPGQLPGRKIAVWGVSFKPGTDDIREAPSLTLVESLLASQAIVSVHDPVALEHFRKEFGDRVKYHYDPYAILDGADALVIVTEWPVYRKPDFAKMQQAMQQPVIFDGRNLFVPEEMKRLGFRYEGIGLNLPNP